MHKSVVKRERKEERADRSILHFRRAKQYSVPHFDHLEELLQARRDGSIKVDGIILATPNKMHVDGAIACAQHGLPTLIEKPVAATLAGGEQLLEELKKYAVPMLVGHHRRHSGALSTAMAAIASGKLGRVVSVTGHAQFYKPAAYFAAGPWRTKSGGGPVLINLIHEIDNLRAMCGEVEAVQAMSSNAVRGYEVEDTVVISFRFSSGALGCFTLSDTATGPMSWEQTSGENKDYGRDTNADCYFVAGTRASLAVPTMKIWENSGEESDWFKPLEISRLEFEEVDPLVNQLKHFSQVIRGVAEPKVTVQSALDTLRVVDGIQRAIQSDGTVYLRGEKARAQSKL